MTAESQRQGEQPIEHQWLVRSVENQISGPFSLGQVREMIEQGKLKLGDEVCGANAYWFYLHEAEEVRSQLGIQLPQRLYFKNADEATETDTNLDRTDPRVSLDVTAEDLPELESAIDEIGENTAVMSNRSFRDFRQKKNPASAPTPQPQAQVVMKPVVPMSGSTSGPARSLEAGRPAESPGFAIERATIFQVLAYIMMVIAVVLIIGVIKLLQQPPR